MNRRRSGRTVSPRFGCVTYDHSTEEDFFQATDLASDPPVRDRFASGAIYGGQHVNWARTAST
jgi:hypothetical protein